jgi:hypothetical protein
LLATDTLAACFWADQGTFYLSLDQEGPTGWGWTLRGQQLYTPRAGEGGVSSYQAIYAAAEASRARAGAQCWQADKAYPISDWIFTKKMIEPIRGLPTWFWLIILRDIPDKAYDPLVLQWELTWRARFLTQTTAEGRDATEVLLKLIGDTWDGTLVADSAQIPWETWAAILVRISAGGPEARDAWRAFTAKPSWPRKLADLRAYDELADAWEVNCDVHLSALSKTHLDLLAVDPFRPVELIVRIGSPCGVVGWAKGIDDITGLSFCASMGSLEDGQWQAIKAVSPASMLNVWNWRVWSWVQRWNEYLSLASNPAPLQSATMIGWEAQSLNLLPDLYGTLAERGKIRQNIPENPTFLRDFLLAWDLRDAWISGEHTERLLLTWEAHNHWLTYALDSTYQGYQGFTLLPIGGPEAGQLWIVSEDYFQTPASDLVQRPPNKVTIPLAKGIDYLVDPEDHDHVLAMVFTGWQPKMASKFWRVYGSDIAQWRDNGGWSEDTLSHIATRVLQLWGTSKYVQPYKDFYLRYFHQGSGGRRSK